MGYSDTPAGGVRTYTRRRRLLVAIADAEL